MDTRRALLGVVIPDDYSRNLALGKEAQVQILLDGSDSNTATIAMGYAEGLVAGLLAAAFSENAQRQRAGSVIQARRRRARCASGTTPIWCRGISSCRD